MFNKKTPFFFSFQKKKKRKIICACSFLFGVNIGGKGSEKTMYNKNIIIEATVVTRNSLCCNVKRFRSDSYFLLKIIIHSSLELRTNSSSVLL